MANDEYSYGTGRRKTASARVRVYPGQGRIVVNDKPVHEYFPRESDLATLAAPLVVVGRRDNVDVVVRVLGGGVSGQVGAVRQGLARALAAMDPEFRPPLKRGGFLTRDDREKERKKPGLKRARKAPQYTKR
jgi:small subunit ribosomal protein S9